MFLSLILWSLDMSWDLYPSLVSTSTEGGLGVKLQPGHLAALVKGLVGKKDEIND